MKTSPPATPVLCVECGASGSAARCKHCGAARRVKGYAVRRLVARTPHSRVYEVERDGATLALKELLFSQVPDAASLDAFERECQLLEALEHPRIPRFVESFSEGEGVQLRLYLVQEFVTGESVLDWVKGKRVPEQRAVELGLQVLETLAFLHERVPPVIHRDVKPANLIERGPGDIVLVDFGAARALAHGATHGATLVGTFGYMPLEQLGGSVDASSDVYALGATLMHLLSGKSPAELFQPDVGLDVRRHVQASPALVKLLQEMTARDPRRRIRSAREAHARLAKLRSAGSVLAAPPQNGGSVPPEPAPIAAPGGVTGWPAFDAGLAMVRDRLSRARLGAREGSSDASRTSRASGSSWPSELTAMAGAGPAGLWQPIDVVMVALAVLGAAACFAMPREWLPLLEQVGIESNLLLMGWLATLGALAMVRRSAAPD